MCWSFKYNQLGQFIGQVAHVHRGERKEALKSQEEEDARAIVREINNSGLSCGDHLQPPHQQKQSVNYIHTLSQIEQSRAASRV